MSIELPPHLAASLKRCNAALAKIEGAQTLLQEAREYGASQAVERQMQATLDAIRKGDEPEHAIAELLKWTFDLVRAGARGDFRYAGCQNH